MNILKKNPKKVFDATLERNKKGVFCRQPVEIEYEFHHPRFGDMTSCKTINGKYVFPSKQCQERVCSGKAFVNIVKEYENYAIADVEMEKMYLPEENREIADYFLRMCERHEGIVIRRNSKKGDYIYINEWMQPLLIYQDKRGSWHEEETYEVIEFDDDAKNVQTWNYADFISMSISGKPIAEYVKDFKNFKMYQDDKYYHPENWTLNDELLDDAAEYGFLKVHNWKDQAMFVTISEPKLASSLIDFTDDEIYEIIKKATEINAKADEAVIKIVKSGVSLDSLI